MTAFTFRPLATLLIILLFLGCSKEEPTPPKEEESPISVSSVDIITSDTRLQKDASLQLELAIVPADAENSEVTWTSSDTSIVMVDSNGLITGIAPGVATITATSNDNGDISDAVTITVFELSSTKNIELFKINGNTGEITDFSISFEFLEGTAVTNLIPVIEHDGASISPDSGVSQDFTQPVIYTVVAEDGTTQEWEVRIDFVSPPPAGSEFITTWKTDNPGTSEDNQITIPTDPNRIYDYAVDWGDGTMDSGVTGNITHTYDVPGVYTVSISGLFPAIYFANPFNNKDGDDDKILSIEQWGTNPWQSMTNAFAGCDNLDMKAYDIPNFSQGPHTNFMFARCSKLIGTTAMNQWEMGLVEITVLMFLDTPLFNQDISDWDMSSNTNINGMFSGASSFNQPVGKWIVDNVEHFGSAFLGATAFNQDLSNWNTSKATSMNGMFLNAHSFNQDVSAWNVDLVTDMTALFNNAKAFDQDLSGWNVGNVEYMGGMFDDSGLSTSNYDALLIAWSELPILQNGVTLGAATKNFCEGESARQALIDSYGWTIQDDGKSCGSGN